MLIDGRNGSLEPVVSYDVVVIGAGPAGIAMAHELRDTGLRIALLESGGLDFDPDTQELYDGVMAGNDDEFDLTAARLRFFGGTSNHWGGRCLPMDAIDFDRGPGNGLSGWPFPRADLDPYYARAHQYCDIGPYWYDLGQVAGLNTSDLLLSEDDRIETNIIRQSEPTRFGDKYLPVLEDSPGVDVWLWTNAVRLDVGADGVVAGVDTRTLSGVERSFRAPTIVLATGAVENARLLLVSNAENGTAYGDAGGLLGRCYMDHPTGGAGFLQFAKPVAELAYWSDIDKFATDGIPMTFVMRFSDSYLMETGLPNFQYYVIPLSADPAEFERQRAANESISSLKEIGKWALGRDVAHDFSLSKEYCEFITNADSFAAREYRALTRGEGVDRVLLKYEAEQKPERTSYVALTEERDALGLPKPLVDWSPTRADIDAVIETVTLTGQIVGEAALGRVQIEDHESDPYWGMTTSWHQMGTTRMAQTATGGVVDPNCQVFGTNGLYIAGGSVMPSAGRANPTLTIVALALRLSDHIRERSQSL